ncbi:hypothetical protein [Aeromonas caviae]|uniref:hypothetical protein n=1 Tax=Aeromonas caviae TaxID=648 RepID=UPI003C7C9519
MNPPSGEGGAKLSLVIDVDELDPASVVIQGKAIDGSGSSMTFNEVATAPRFGVDLSALKAAGQYKVEATLFGTTRLGREVQLQLPAKSFTIAPPPLPPAPSAAMPASAATPDRFEERESPVWLPWALGGGGVLLLLLGAGGFILLQKRRTLHKAMAAQKAQLEETPATPKLDLNLPEQ